MNGKKEFTETLQRRADRRESDMQKLSDKVAVHGFQQTVKPQNFKMTPKYMPKGR